MLSILYPAGTLEDSESRYLPLFGPIARNLSSYSSIIDALDDEDRDIGGRKTSKVARSPAQSIPVVFLGSGLLHSLRLRT